MSKWREIQTCNDVVPFQPGKSTKVRKLCINRVHSGPRPSTIVTPRSFVARGNKYLGLWAHLFTRLIYNHFELRSNLRPSKMEIVNRAY